MHRSTCVKAVMALVLVTGGQTAIHAEGWHHLMGCDIPRPGNDLRIAIEEPANGRQYLIRASGPRKTELVTFRLSAHTGTRDVTGEVDVRWDLMHEWYMGYPEPPKNHRFEDQRSLQGNPATTYFEVGSLDDVPIGPLGRCDGYIAVTARVTYRGKTYTSDRVNINVGGEQPEIRDIYPAFRDLTDDVGRLRAIGWKESSHGTTPNEIGWYQFREYNEDPSPFRYFTDDERSFGIMQVNEKDWFHLGPWEFTCWHWDRNIWAGSVVFNDVREHFTPQQRTWDPALQLDLQTYGYNHGWSDMQQASQTDVAADDYVRRVRQLEEYEPWLRHM